MEETPSSFNTKYQSNSTESKIVVALERISEAFRVLLWQESKIHKLSPIQLQIVTFLLFHDENKRKVSYLAKEFNMTKATISDAVKTLEKKGLIQKEITPSDTRSYIIHLTEKGKVIAEKASTFSHAMRESVELFGGEEAEQFYQTSLKLIESLHKNGIIQLQRMCSSCLHYAKDNGMHFCKLLNKPLTTNELRIDCPEHIPID